MALSFFTCLPQTAQVTVSGAATADLAVTRVRGTKNPERAAIIALAPDLVIANREENRELDVTRLREAGLAVWVTVIESVPQALASMRRPRHRNRRSSRARRSRVSSSFRDLASTASRSERRSACPWAR